MHNNGNDTYNALILLTLFETKNQLAIIKLQKKTINDGNRTSKHVFINAKSLSNNTQYFNRQFIGMDSMQLH